MSIKVKQTKEGQKKYFGLEIYKNNGKKMGCHINVDDNFNTTLHCKSNIVISFEEIQCIINAMTEYGLKRKFEKETNKKIDLNGNHNTRGGASLAMLLQARFNPFLSMQSQIKGYVG